MPVMELLAADRRQEVREVLDGDGSSPTVAGLLEEQVRLAHVLKLTGVVLPRPGLREPVVGPCLATDVPDRFEGCQRLQEQAAGDEVVPDIGFDAPQGEQCPRFEVFITGPGREAPRIVGRVGCLPMTAQLDEALGSSERQPGEQLEIDLPLGCCRGADGPPYSDSANRI